MRLSRWCSRTLMMLAAMQAGVFGAEAGGAEMPGGKPNILIILCDDLGWSNASCYHQGVMASPTPNIDRIAAEGVRLTDCYAQASCTAGRAALITGQIPMRTGLTTVGMPGAPQGIQPEDPTLGDLLKAQG
jgi:arylsulfatase A-like enzyme